MDAVVSERGLNAALRTGNTGPMQARSGSDVCKGQFDAAKARSYLPPAL